MTLNVLHQNGKRYIIFRIELYNLNYFMTVLIPVKCIHCFSTDVIKHGKSAEGKQRYRCLNGACPYTTFILEYSYPGRLKDVKQKIVEMTLNGSGIRDIARVLNVSSATVIKELKKRPQAQPSQSYAAGDP